MKEIRGQNTEMCALSCFLNVGLTDCIIFIVHKQTWDLFNYKLTMISILVEEPESIL